MLDKITYNRSEKRYEFVDHESGEILTAPAKMKHELFKAVVGLLDPDLFDAAHRIIENNPHLERLVWKATGKVIEGGVEVFPEPVNGVEAMVISSDQWGRYSIINDNGYYACNCPAFSEMYAPITESGGRYCSHILAYRLYLRTRESRF